VCLALLACGVAACSHREPGIVVEVSMLHHMGDEAPFDVVRNGAGMERGMVTDRGYGVALSRIQLVIGRLELVPCDEAQARLPRPARAWDELVRFLSPVSVAHAHGSASPLALAAPHVIDLMAQDRAAFEYGTLAPPPDRYCALRVHVEPADADAEGLAGDPALVGRSLWLEGNFIDGADPNARPLALGSELSERIDVPFVDGHGAPRELQVSEASPLGEVRLELSYGHLLDGIDLRQDAPEQQQYMAIRNLLRSLSAVVGE
jgi:hypothetical protein